MAKKKNPTTGEILTNNLKTIMDIKSTKETKQAARQERDRKAKQAAMLLKQASDPTRLQVLMLLAEQERNVGTLCTDLGSISQPAVSHHLALLRHGRLVEPRRSGKENVYSLTDQGRVLAEAVRGLAENGNGAP